MITFAKYKVINTGISGEAKGRLKKVFVSTFPKIKGSHSHLEKTQQAINCLLLLLLLILLLQVVTSSQSQVLCSDLLLHFRLFFCVFHFQTLFEGFNLNTKDSHFKQVTVNTF